MTLVIRCEHGSRLNGQRCLECDPLVPEPRERRSRLGLCWADLALFAALLWAVALTVAIVLGGCVRGGGAPPTCPVKAPQATNTGGAPGGGAGSCEVR